MTGTTILQLGAIAIAGTICGLVLKKQTPELALVLGLVTVCILLWKSREALEQVLSLMEELAGLSGLSQEVLTPLVKTVGIAILTKLAGQICRDGGMGSVSSFLEVAGSLAALVTVTPLVRAVLEVLEGLL